MIRTFFVVALLLLATEQAVADDKPPELTIRQVLEINTALGNMNCEMKVLRDGAKETSMCVPYSPDRLKVGLAWQIAETQRKTMVAAQQYQKVVNGYVATLAHKADGTLTDESATKLALYQADLLDRNFGETLPHFKRSELEPLNLQPSLIAGLMPIIDP